MFKQLPVGGGKLCTKANSCKIFNQVFLSKKGAFLLCFSILLTFRLLAQTSAPCTGNPGEIGGRVVGDYNYNGQDDQTGGVRQVSVYLFGNAGQGASLLLDSTLTDWDGYFHFSGLANGRKYRLEFKAPAGWYPGFGGGAFGSDVQWVAAPNCDILAAFSNPEDYCEQDPDLITTCFVNGDPLPANSEVRDMDVIVAFPYSSSGQTTMPNKLVRAYETGSVYGIAYDRFKKISYTSAFLKRHVGLGTLGLGGIYSIQTQGNTTSVQEFLNLSTVGISAGNIPSNSGRGLPSKINLPSNDSQAYGQVGKIGIGAIDLSYDGQTLWVVNLFNKNIYAIAVDADNNPNTMPASRDIKAFPLPNPGCIGGTFRPFALKVHRGKVYVGGVCDASLSQDSTNLEAIIYRLDNQQFTEILRYNLSFRKGWAANQNNCEFYPGWYPWKDQVPVACDQGPTRVYPQPVLSDIEFDVDGSMIIGFMDRLGHQLGYKNYPIQGSSELLSTISGGDVMRAFLQDNGQYQIEHNATAGPLTTGGANNGEGPGGGEFYYRDVFEGQINNLIPAPHAETAQGGLAFLPGSGEFATTALDPYSTVFNSGGINWMHTQTAAVRDAGYVLYRSSSSNISSFSKANGLGDLDLMCGIAPIQIGGLVWNDTNSDGIQDPSESPLAGIRVQIRNSAGTVLGTVTTNAKGEYYFQNQNLQTGSLTPQTDYFLVFGTGGQFNPQTRLLNQALYLTQANTGLFPNSDANDSDAQLAGPNVLGGQITGYPFISIRTGNFGFVSHSFDAGFNPLNLTPFSSIGGLAFKDCNQNGMHDPGEKGLAQIRVSLSGDAQAVTFTDAQGHYNFSNLLPGNYRIKFDLPAVGGFAFSPQDRGTDDQTDSDVNPVTGFSDVIQLQNNQQLRHIFAGMADIQAPIFINTPGDTTVDCGDPFLLAPPTLLATDNCDPAIAVILNLKTTFSDHCDLDGFLQKIEYSWTASDSCGNTSVWRMTVTIVDRVPPVLYHIPGNLNLDLRLGDTIPALSNQVVASDSCSGVASLTVEETQTDTDCEITILRTWTARDGCGNTSRATQSISVLRPCDCPGVEIAGADVTPACNGVGGRVSILTTDTPDGYRFVWIPNRGTPNATGNLREDLPAGVYLIILEHRVAANCSEKIYVEVKDDCLIPQEICDNGLDDDGDGFTDCQDQDCPCFIDCADQPTLFHQDKLEFTTDDCQGQVTVCLPVSMQEFLAFDWTINGQAAVLPAGSCDHDTTYSYGYASLLQMAPQGPYLLDSWAMGQSSHRGSFPNLQALVQAMNRWDPQGSWVLDAAHQVISGGSPGLIYGHMQIRSQLYPGISILEPNFQAIAGGTLISLPVGEYLLEGVHTQTACHQAIRVAVVCQPLQLQTDTVEIEINVGEEELICLLQDELNEPTYSNWTFENGDQTILEIMESDAFCFSLRAIHPGQAVIRFALCQDASVCDATVLKVQVFSNGTGPKARPDFETLSERLPYLFNPLHNDDVTAAEAKFRLLSAARKGQIIRNPDLSLTYLPDPDYCGTDILEYEICDGSGCDTSRIELQVPCGDILEVVSGFSPNGDGINDSFKIMGIKESSNHELHIFNRWGSLVFHSTNYQNDWQGTSEGNQLPDGTYFYLLSIEGRKKSGYFQLQR